MLLLFPMIASSLAGFGGFPMTAARKAHALPPNFIAELT
jgi:hypothetical protein